MNIKKRILDYYFLSQLRRKGIQATEEETTRYFEETGWRFYDFDSMKKSFISWRKAKQTDEASIKKVEAVIEQIVAD